MNNKNHIRKIILFIFLVALVGFACEIPGLPSEGTPGVLPTQEPGEPTTPPVEPTEPPLEPEPTAPPEVEPTAPSGGELPPSEGDGGTSETVIQVLFWLLVLVVIILGIALIVSLFTGRSKDPGSAPVEPTPEKTPSYAETQAEAEGPQPVQESISISALDQMSTKVAPLYDRFVNLLKGLGPVTILPTPSRVDFQRRIIFASVQFSQEDMRVQLVLPRREDDPRMVRIEVFIEDKVSHTMVIRSLDDFDAHFTKWLQEAYNLGS